MSAPGDDIAEQVQALAAFLPLLRRLAAYEYFVDEAIGETVERLRDGAAVAAGQLVKTGPLPPAMRRPEGEEASIPGLPAVIASDYGER